MDNPEIWIILVIVGFLIFGAKRMPDAARGLGRSLRIFKAETKGLMTDDVTPAPAAAQPLAQAQIPPVYAQPAPAPVYAQPAPAPVYAQPAPAPVYQQPVAPPAPVTSAVPVVADQQPVPERHEAQ